MAIYELDGVAPQVHTQAWVAPSAQVMGQVSVGAGASIWFGTVVRGDTERITIGADSNIQDASVLHADAGQPLVIGERVTVEHDVKVDVTITQALNRARQRTQIAAADDAVDATFVDVSPALPARR